MYFWVFSDLGSYLRFLVVFVIGFRVIKRDFEFVLEDLVFFLGRSLGRVFWNFFLGI